ncbi:MAG: metal-sensing transcriptional repressor [Lachnospiraceae bacterium]|jgi:DNA-binding FrmR family transcriptional regulator|nr:metal-sensing transcriptional repressor [Lachnospiraceae bacterium]MCI1727584.1 metal-sensing transcriptional repressor [Lachnospiraceae bacterium]
MMADPEKISRLVKTARGQLDGVLRMIDEDKYCIDICNQLMAADSIIRKANNEILRAHMKGCVKTAMEEGRGDEKIDELIGIIEKLK